MDSQFLVVPFKRVYNCILDKPFSTTIAIVAPLIHLKLKFHSLHGEPLMINVNLEGAKRIDRTVHHDQYECEAMEINVASLTVCRIHPRVIGSYPEVNHSSFRFLCSIYQLKVQWNNKEKKASTRNIRPSTKRTWHVDPIVRSG